MLVHRVEPAQHLAEALGADREHRREADRRVHRVAAADPVPEAECVLGVDAEARDLLEIRRDGHEVLRHGGGVRAERAQQPRARRLGVGHRLERRERLRADDEERALCIQVARRLGEVRPVHVGDEAERHVALAVVAQRPVGHHGAEVGAADADVDDARDRLAGVAPPLARADPLGERGHAVEHLVHVRDDVAPVDDQRALARHAQGDVQHRAVLGDVDVLAGEHGVAPLGHARLFSQLNEQTEGLVAHAILRIVEVDPGGLGGQPGASLGVGCEEIAQVSPCYVARDGRRARDTRGAAPAASTVRLP